MPTRKSKPATSSPQVPANKSRSARAKHHDWEALFAQVRDDSWAVLEGQTTVPWDTRYVHAIERALRGRKSEELYALLDGHHWLHPVLLPALADVIRSQRDAARGKPAKLTARQDATIRSVIDRRGASFKWPNGETAKKRLARLYGVSVDLINESLQRTRQRQGK